jgi:hypothetical protein
MNHMDQDIRGDVVTLQAVGAQVEIERKTQKWSTIISLQTLKPSAVNQGTKFGQPAPPYHAPGQRGDRGWILHTPIFACVGRVSVHVIGESQARVDVAEFSGPAQPRYCLPLAARDAAS